MNFKFWFVIFLDPDYFYTDVAFNVKVAKYVG